MPQCSGKVHYNTDITSCLCRASSSIRHESWELSQVFLGYLHNSIHVHILFIPGNVFDIFKNPYEYLISFFFSFKNFGHLPVTSASSTAIIYLFFLQMSSWKRLHWESSESDQIAQALRMGASRELWDKSSNKKSLEVMLLGRATFMSAPVAPRLRISLWLQACWISKLLWNWGESNNNKTSQNVTKLAVLTELQPFFLNKYSLDCCKFV